MYKVVEVNQKYDIARVVYESDSETKAECYKESIEWGNRKKRYLTYILTRAE